MGTTPTLTWGAPTLGTPQRYRAKVDRLGISNGATRVAATFTFDTAGTSVTFPPGLLVAGQQSACLLRRCPAIRLMFTADLAGVPPSRRTPIDARCGVVA